MSKQKQQIHQKLGELMRLRTAILTILILKTSLPLLDFGMIMIMRLITPGETLNLKKSLKSIF